MSIRNFCAAAGLAALAVAGWAVPTQALTMKECSAKYKDARSSGMLSGMTWNEFRKAQCGAQPTATNTPRAGGRTNYFDGGNAQQPSGGNTNWFGGSQKRYGYGAGAIFPPGVSPKYAGMSQGKARMHTCLDQYRANKASGGNGTLKWVQKGGGYYSQCNRQLKGQ